MKYIEKNIIDCMRENVNKVNKLHEEQEKSDKKAIEDHKIRAAEVERLEKEIAILRKVMVENRGSLVTNESCEPREPTQFGDWRNYTDINELEIALKELTDVLIETIHKRGFPNDLEWVVKDKFIIGDPLLTDSTVGWKADFYE